MSFQNAFLGSLVGDAVSMPVHWYYNTDQLDKDYGDFQDYMAPKSYHPDSILWRSKCNPSGTKDNIYHNQSKYWGMKGIHYHQFLQSGENTLNLKLSVELYKTIISKGRFNLEDWLNRYTEVMLTPDWHNDTYIEEFHRGFFSNFAKGNKLTNCGIDDIHIGGLSLIPALLAGLEAIGDFSDDHLLQCTNDLVSSTHRNKRTISAAHNFCKILTELNRRAEIRDTLSTLRLSEVSLKKLKIWENWPDRKVVGTAISPACYLPDALTGSLYFSWKYSDDFSLAILSNAKAGGDNCHRGVVVGSMVAMQTGIPPKWLKKLKSMEKLICGVN